MKINWSLFNLPFFISAALAVTGGLYAISEANHMAARQAMVERQLIFNFELNQLERYVQAADASLLRYFESKRPADARGVTQFMNSAWTRVGTLWQLEEGNPVWEVQCALHTLHAQLDKQVQQFAATERVSPDWREDRKTAFSTFYSFVRRLRSEVVPNQAQESVTSSARNLSIAVFLTPLMAIIMLFLAFRYMYRMQQAAVLHSDAMNRAKSQFLANMSHEIRTPLTAVVGYAEVLNQPQISHDLHEKCVSGIKRNGSLLVNLVNDILDLSKIEAEKLEIQSVGFDLGEIFREVESVMALKTQERGIQLSLELDPSAKGVTSGDPIRIKQILLNVIGNAVKFTLQGKVRVSAAVADGRRLTIDVSDTGIGLSPQAAARLFQPFTQIDSSNERNFGGTGLGLTISRQLARAMGGDVTLLYSNEGLGSTFRIEILLASPVIPSIAPPLSAEATPTLEHWRGKSILVVDDCEDNRELVGLYLSATGIRVLTAASADEAMKVIQHQTPDAILLDIQMPGKNGYDTAREIRALGIRIPIIAFTAHALVREIDQCRASGCDTVLTKPVLRKNLIAVLDNYLSPA